MPRYQVTLDGKTFVVEGDRPPTEAEARQAFEAYRPPTPAEPVKAAAPEKSVGGFLENAVSSTLKLGKDTAVGLKDVLSFIGRNSPMNADHSQRTDPAKALATIRALPGALKDMVSSRYGSLDAVKDTLYNDPAGALADLSTLTGLGASATAARAPRIAATLRKVESATNPLNAAAKPVAAAGGRMQRGAVSAYERMLKPNKSTLEGMPRMGSSLQERSRRVAEELIRDPNGQISKTGALRYKDATGALQAQVDAIVDANPEARGSTAHLQRELESGRGRFAQQWAPGGDVASYNAVADEVLRNPRVTKAKRSVIDTSLEHALDMAPAASEVAVTGRTLLPRIRAATARNLTQGTYRNLSDKAYGELKGAATEAQKAAARGGRAILNEALPEVAPINNQIAKRIDLGDVLDEAVLRSGKHDPIGLSQQVVLSGNAPGMILASLVNRPGLGSPLARGLYKAGGALQVPTTEGLMRAALLARLTAEDSR